MRANSWLYHYYSVQSKLQYGFGYDTHASAAGSSAPMPMGMSPFYQHQTTGYGPSRSSETPMTSPYLSSQSANVAEPAGAGIGTGPINGGSHRQGLPSPDLTEQHPPYMLRPSPNPYHIPPELAHQGFPHPHHHPYQHQHHYHPHAMAVAVAASADSGHQHELSADGRYLNLSSTADKTTSSSHVYPQYPPGYRMSRDDVYGHHVITDYPLGLMHRSAVAAATDYTTSSWEHQAAQREQNASDCRSASEPLVARCTHNSFPGPLEDEQADGAVGGKRDPSHAGYPAYWQQNNRSGNEGGYQLEQQQRNGTKAQESAVAATTNSRCSNRAAATTASTSSTKRRKVEYVESIDKDKEPSLSRHSSPGKSLWLNVTKEEPRNYPRISQHGGFAGQQSGFLTTVGGAESSNPTGSSHHHFHAQYHHPSKSLGSYCIQSFPQSQASPNHAGGEGGPGILAMEARATHQLHPFSKKLIDLSGHGPDVEETEVNIGLDTSLLMPNKVAL